jgi:hypothetical protein
MPKCATCHMGSRGTRSLLGSGATVRTSDSISSLRSAPVELEALSRSCALATAERRPITARAISSGGLRRRSSAAVARRHEDRRRQARLPAPSRSRMTMCPRRLAMRPSLSSSLIATVTPGRRTQSIMGINSCVSSSSSPSMRSSAISSQRAKRSSSLALPLASGRGRSAHKGASCDAGSHSGPLLRASASTLCSGPGRRPA